MRTCYAVLSGLIALALIIVAGACATDETTTVTTTTTTVADTTTIPAVAADAPPSYDDDGTPPYDGLIGPGSPLYGLKIAFEGIDESFTFNETDRLNKQLNNARIRLSEAKRELILNNTVTADEALDLYWQKINNTQMHLSALSSDNETGLLHAQEMITKHQLVLEDLMLAHPDNTGLARAYNNSRALEEKFEQKTSIKFERVMVKNNETMIKAVRLEVKEQEHTANHGDVTALQVEQTRQEQQGPGSMKGDEKGNTGNRVVVNQTSQQGGPAQPATGNNPSGQGTDQGSGKPATTVNDGNGNTNNRGNAGNGVNIPPDNRGQGNGRNK